jgi:hypothetical protein
MDFFSLASLPRMPGTTRQHLDYRIETEEKVVVYSGDTEASSRVAALTADTQMLFPGAL